MKELVKRVLRSLSYRLGYQNLDHLSLLLNSRLRKVDEFFIIQIGANDGTTYDPIHDFIVTNRSRVKGIMLEPLRDFYEQLVRTYGRYPGIQALPLAIHNSEKTMLLHRVDPERLSTLPSFVKGIASFDADYHTKSNTPSDAIVAERVNCITMSELIANYGVKKIDLLCVDTEGYDAEILRALDFDNIRPAIIMFEHGLRNGVMSGDTFAEVVMRLNQYGYDVMIQDYDVIAHLRDRLAIGSP